MKDDPQVWATSFPHLKTLTEKEENLNPKAMITYKRPITTGQILAQLQAPCFEQDERAYQRCVKSLQPLCSFWSPWETQ